MDDITTFFAILLILAGFLTGSLGGVFGIGGGVFLTPALVFLFRIPVHWAIPASLGCVAAGSLASTARHLRSGTLNLRIAVVVSLGAAAGGTVGGFVGDLVSPRAILLILSGTIGLAALITALTPEQDEVEVPIFAGEGADQWPGTLGGTYDVGGGVIPYEANHPVVGSIIAAGAGVLGSIAGIGGGFMNVPQMRLVMKLPARVASATSIFVVGTTASAGLLVYYKAGKIVPMIVAPLVFGTTIGGTVGSHLASRLKARSLHHLLILILVALSLTVAWSASGY